MMTEEKIQQKLDTVSAEIDALEKQRQELYANQMRDMGRIYRVESRIEELKEGARMLKWVLRG